MKKSLFTAILSLAFVFLIGGIAHAQTVPVSGNLGTVTRGGTTRGSIVLKHSGQSARQLESSEQPIRDSDNRAFERERRQG